MGLRQKVVDACYARSKRKDHYWNGTSGYGCSAAARAVLADVGIFSEAQRNDSNALWAAQGKTAGLDNSPKLKKMPADTKLIPSDIIMYLWHHVAINIENGTKIFEAAPHLNSRGQITHPLSDDGGEVGIYSNHAYNCAGVPITAIYRIIEEDENMKMTVFELVNKLEEILSYPTHYRGTNGSTEARFNIGQWDGQNFCFDCSGLIKAILWGWSASKSAAYGGAVYCSNGVPDINDAGFYNACEMHILTDINAIPVGALLWKPGHVGVYVGNGYAIECTPAFNNGVQKTAVAGRGWQAWGYMPYVEYDSAAHTTLRYGSSGDEVKVLQTLLNGFGASLAVDGFFGPATKAAVIAFQKSKNLLQDATVGPLTWEALLTEEKKEPEYEKLTESELLKIAHEAYEGKYKDEVDHHKHKLSELYGDDQMKIIQQLINYAHSLM